MSLTPASPGMMNRKNKTNGASPESNKSNKSNKSHKTKNHLSATPASPVPSPVTNGNTKASTIRTVPSFDIPSEPSSPSARNSGFSGSVHSSASVVSDISQSEQSASTVRLKAQSPEPTSPINMSEGPTSPSLSDTTPKANDNAPDVSLQTPNTTPVDDHFAHEASPQWDGAVGKAGLGKTGRVINKLVSDNEALKRDLQIERLKAEESKQAAKLLEDKMERMVSEYESRLLEANVTKTLLNRKERQVESLQSAVELEKKRTTDAQDRERTWRDEMEKSRRDANVQVEEANQQAALMEGRYNAISSHWKGQGDEVKRAMVGLNKRIEALNLERKSDDDRINTLRDLCDQQNGNIRDLIRQKDEITRAFEDYKRQQETMLKDIKEHARAREEEQARNIEESRRVLGQLRWALNVKQNVKGAQ